LLLIHLARQLPSLHNHTGNDAKADWKEGKARGSTLGDEADNRSLGE